MYCQNCGSRCEGNYCPVCGAKLSLHSNNTNTVIYQPVNGNRRKIAGILGVVFSGVSLIILLFLMQLSIITAIPEVPFVLILAVFSIPTAIAGLVLSINTRIKGFKIPGIIASSLALLISMIAFFIAIS